MPKNPKSKKRRKPWRFSITFGKSEKELLEFRGKDLNWRLQQLIKDVSIIVKVNQKGRDKLNKNELRDADRFFHKALYEAIPEYYCKLLDDKQLEKEIAKVHEKNIVN